MAYYGSVAGGDTYFGTRLHSEPWELSSAADKLKALYTATRIIDRLNYIGDKHTVYVLYLAYEDESDADLEDVRAANAAQELEFPRGADTTVPTDIEIVTYEIAMALLDGVDPDLELENLGVTTQSYAGVKTAYNRDQQPIEHLLHGVPSAFAWRILKPFIRDSRAVTTIRVN